MELAAARALLSKKLAITLSGQLNMLGYREGYKIEVQIQVFMCPVDPRGDALPATTRKVCLGYHHYHF